MSTRDPLKLPGLLEAREPAPTTIFVCKECDGARDVRRAMKTAIKAAHRRREIAVVSCACLDVCPKRGAAAMVTGRRGPARCVVIGGDAADQPRFLVALVDERVSDPVAKEDGTRLPVIVEGGVVVVERR